MTTTNPIITAQRVPSNHRMAFLPRLFGRQFMRAESRVFEVARELTNGVYDGGYWEFYRLSNGSGFMVPSLEGKVRLSWWGNGFEGEGRARDIGIICTLHALADTHPDNYYRLRDYVFELPEADTDLIIRAID